MRKQAYKCMHSILRTPQKKCLMQFTPRLVIHAAWRMAIAKLRPKLECELAKWHVTWDDVLPVLRLVDSLEELQAALEDPDGFLTKLASAAGPAAKRFLVAKLRKPLEPIAMSKGLVWYQHRGSNLEEATQCCDTL